MRVLRIHRWDITPKQAIALQQQLKDRLDAANRIDPAAIRRLAAADVSYDRSTDRVFAVVLLFSFPQLDLLEKRTTVQPATFPYVPGLLTFREGPALVKVFASLSQEPDIALFDGQGVAHPRGIGIASHMGLLLDKPSIGCAKTVLIGDYHEPDQAAGSSSYLTTDGRTIGAALRTRAGVRPIFVSVGHKIDLKTAVEVVLQCTRGYRLPEPVRQAHLASTQLRVAG